MLPKRNRLEKKRILVILKKGKSLFSKKLKIKYLQTQLSFSRFAFLIPLKISKKATRRNRFKRQLREIVRLKIKEKKVKGGFDIVFIAKILETDYHLLEKEIDIIFKRLKILQL